MIFRGNPHSRKLALGEAPGREEIEHGRAFVGQAGQLLDAMAAKAGLDLSDWMITNVCHSRPPQNEIAWYFATKKKVAERQASEIWGCYATKEVHDGVAELLSWCMEHKPYITLAIGNPALWAATAGRCTWRDKQDGKPAGISRWRGSELPAQWGGKIIPVIHPAAIMRDWSEEHVAVQDLRRVAREVQYEGLKKPEWHFIIRPSYERVRETLRQLRELSRDREFDLVVDTEWRAGQIACIGLAISKFHCICIPFMCVEREEGYWSAEEELEIVKSLRALLTSPMTKVVMQHGLSDCTLIANQWGYIPNVCDDTMIMWHCAFPGLPKRLDFIASLLNEHYCYWKDDGREWEPGQPEEQLWSYNCEDCVRTFENLEETRKIIKHMGLEEQYAFLIQLFRPLLKMQLRGININKKFRAEVDDELEEAAKARRARLEYVLGHPFNPRSNGPGGQMQALFYEDLGCRVQRHRKSKKPTLDAEALEKIKVQYPLLRPLCNMITEVRSLEVFRNFTTAELDEDGRIRGSINPTGAETYRLSMEANAFGRGTNLMNIPKGEDV